MSKEFCLEGFWWIFTFPHRKMVLMTGLCCPSLLKSSFVLSPPLRAMPGLFKACGLKKILLGIDSPTCALAGSSPSLPVGSPHFSTDVQHRSLSFTRLRRPIRRLVIGLTILHFFSTTGTIVPTQYSEWQQIKIHCPFSPPVCTSIGPELICA